MDEKGQFSKNKGATIIFFSFPFKHIFFLFYPSSLIGPKDWHRGTQLLATTVKQLLLMLAKESQTRRLLDSWTKGPAENAVVRRKGRKEEGKPKK